MLKTYTRPAHPYSLLTYFPGKNGPNGRATFAQTAQAALPLSSESPRVVLSSYANFPIEGHKIICRNPKKHSPKNIKFANDFVDMFLSFLESFLFGFKHFRVQHWLLFFVRNQLYPSTFLANSRVQQIANPPTACCYNIPKDSFI